MLRAREAKTSARRHSARRTAAKKTKITGRHKSEQIDTYTRIIFQQADVFVMRRS
jgi:hypothetical protein